MRSIGLQLHAQVTLTKSLFHLLLHFDEADILCRVQGIQITYNTRILFKEVAVLIDLTETSECEYTVLKNTRRRVKSLSAAISESLILFGPTSSVEELLSFLRGCSAMSDIKT